MRRKELRRLSKIELLTMLRDQEMEIENLKKIISQLEDQINDKNIRMEKCGSIADAALEINRIFESAQRVADQYINSVKVMKMEDPYFGIEEYNSRQESYFNEIYHILKKRADSDIERYKEREYKKIKDECEKYKQQIVRKSDKYLEELKKKVNSQSYNDETEKDNKDSDN